VVSGEITHVQQAGKKNRGFVRLPPSLGEETWVEAESVRLKAPQSLAFPDAFFEGGSLAFQGLFSDSLTSVSALFSYLCIVRKKDECRRTSGMKN